MKRLCLSILLTCLVQLLTAQNKKPAIAFASDTQEPMWIETLWLKSDHNLQATKMIFENVDSLRPKAFFILGDVVSLGKSKKAWKNIDRYIGQAVKDSIPIYATLGNHEVMFNAKKGILNFKKRFTAYNPLGYVEVIDSVAVILLNSNFAEMSALEIDRQNKWYSNELDSLDNDNAIKLTIVGCHHSPYTNSTIVKPSADVRQNFVPPFIKSKKAILFLSGHSHNFESFKVQGKYFLVIGGGGGLHQPLRANNAQMHDLTEDYKPAFHYLEVKRAGNTLNVLSRKLSPDFKGFSDGYFLQITK
ncbi:metallophosphoesterase family protein [Mucilaginibacter ximonensis]|uniref:Metallophosphoesterase family protein n=1 Tax=Mucilaginibacter ximonensis TaxID=538021 RepID=A0ABW5YAB1_9SPHI